MMKVLQMEVGSLGTNCYIAYCENTKKAVIIDPGGDAARILAAVNREGLTVEAIINTHGHADHVLANVKVKEATGAPLWIHSADADMLGSGSRNLSAYLGQSTSCGTPDRLLRDGEVLTVGDFTLKVLHTPGHTHGGISLLADKEVFVGDTLFAESIGRTDFPGGSYAQLIDSIKTKLMTLDDDVKAYPGHGPATTIGWERRQNPFIQ
ncbi:MAG: putative metallo-hydrolase [Firmicutes bacterium]|nr:putative metallo-hydrolase [Bacillota bacterium]